MAKKFFIMVICILFFMPAICQGQEDYDDLIEVYEEYLLIMEEYLEAVNDSQSADGVAEAMNIMAEEMERIGPSLKEMKEKYPELNKSGKPPEELEFLQERADELRPRIFASFFKLAAYMEDPEVQAAQKRLAVAMKSIE
ncbi:MAG: hypothetical protein GY859_26610 [Desulfobacterales bacterium]|nr:hypothetical protein [Desulfobacterales bacterium]